MVITTKGFPGSMFRISSSDISKRILFLILLVAVNMLFSSTGIAQSNERLLILTGGHEFEREPFFDIFDDMPDVEYQEVIHPHANQWYDSSLIETFDVLIFYDMVQDIDNSQKVALMNLLKSGKGAVFLHHSLVSYQEWEEFEKIIGGKFVYSDDHEVASTYRHDVEISVHIVDKDHPVTSGMADFIIHDEVYGNFKVSSTVNPLLTTTHPESGNIIAWTNHYGNSRIVYLQLGHDHHAYDDPNYRRLIRKSIDWVND